VPITCILLPWVPEVPKMLFLRAGENLCLTQTTGIHALTKSYFQTIVNAAIYGNDYLLIMPFLQARFVCYEFF
jgi:hypothetical protein